MGIILPPIVILAHSALPILTLQVQQLQMLSQTVWGMPGIITARMGRAMLPAMITGLQIIAIQGHNVLQIQELEELQHHLQQQTAIAI